jgi:hypothetical protein
MLAATASHLCLRKHNAGMHQKKSFGTERNGDCELLKDLDLRRGWRKPFGTGRAALLVRPVFADMNFLFAAAPVGLDVHSRNRLFELKFSANGIPDRRRDRGIVVLFNMSLAMFINDVFRRIAA